MFQQSLSSSSATHKLNRTSYVIKYKITHDVTNTYVFPRLRMTQMVETCSKAACTSSCEIQKVVLGIKQTVTFVNRRYCVIVGFRRG